MGAPVRNAARDQAIVAAYRAGRSIRQIAADQALAGGITLQRVHQVLVRRGVPMRAQGGGNRWAGRAS